MLGMASLERVGCGMLVLELSVWPPTPLLLLLALWVSFTDSILEL